jgi:hypothetical protein
MADKKKTVDEYIAGLPSDQQAIVSELRRIVKSAAPEAKEAFKWAQPVFESNGPFAYIKAFRAQVNFGFWRGAQLTNSDNLLVGDGDRMKHIKLRSASDIKKDAFTKFVKEAVKLNKAQGDPSKRMRE